MIKNSDFSLGTYRTQATAALGGQRSIPPSVAHSRCRAGRPHPRPRSRSAGGPHPSPSPALRARGGHGLGIVDRRRRRIATATRISPLPLPVAERKGARGKVRGHHPPLPLPQRGLPSPPAPLPQRGRGVVMASVSLTDAGAGSPQRRESPRFRSPWRSGRERGERCGGIIPPSSPAAREISGGSLST